MKFTVGFLASLAVITVMVSAVNAQLPTLIWSDPIEPRDIVLSKDGQYVALVYPVYPTGGEIRFYRRDAGNPPTALWTCQVAEGLYSVAISANGDSVVAGGDQHVYFWKNARSRTSSTADPTWVSVDLGYISRRCLDISDDGNYLVACGTGDSVFYWANAKSKSGSDVPTTWKYEFIHYAEAIDLSSDGDYVAAGLEDNVAYWKHAKSKSGSGEERNPQPGDPAPNWQAKNLGDMIVDLAVSDDGNYVAAAGRGFPSPVYYWAEAKSLTGDPSTRWESAHGVDFSSIDMSSDGNSVVAGGMGPDPEDYGVYFWGGATGLTGTPVPSWTYTPGVRIEEVAISDLGDYMAAFSVDWSSYSAWYVYFLDSRGDLKWVKETENPFEYGSMTGIISMSGDGGTLAVRIGSGATTYVFDTGYSTINPVGGFIIPVSKLEILTPYLALAGLIVAVSAVYVIKRRKD